MSVLARAPPKPPSEPERPEVVRARIALEGGRWLDVAVDSWHAMDRCDELVRLQLGRFGLAPKKLSRACDPAALPRAPQSAYQLATTEAKFFLTPPNGRYAIDTIVPFDTLDGCEGRKAELEAQEAKAFAQEAAERQRRVEQRIAIAKRMCDEARARGHSAPERFCEVVQVPAPTFEPLSRSCRMSQ